MGSFWEFLKNDFSFKTAILDVFTFGIYGTQKIWEKYFKPKLIITDKDLAEVHKSWWY